MGAVQRLDLQAAISGLAGVPLSSTSVLVDASRSLAQNPDEGGNDSIVPQMPSQSLNLRSRKRSIEPVLRNVKKRPRPVALNLADVPRSLAQSPGSSRKDVMTSLRQVSPITHDPERDLLNLSYEMLKNVLAQLCRVPLLLLLLFSLKLLLILPLNVHLLITILPPIVHLLTTY